MKQLLRLFLSTLILQTAYLSADHSECLDASVYESNELYFTRDGYEDGIFKAVSSSMVAWGVGLFVGICLLTGLVHNSRGTTTPADNPATPLQ